MQNNSNEPLNYGGRNVRRIQSEQDVLESIEFLDSIKDGDDMSVIVGSVGRAVAELGDGDRFAEIVLDDQSVGPYEDIRQIMLGFLERMAAKGNPNNHNIEPDGDIIDIKPLSLEGSRSRLRERYADRLSLMRRRNQ